MTEDEKIEVKNREVVLPNYLAEAPPGEIVDECPKCHEFFLRGCMKCKPYAERYAERPDLSRLRLFCHHYPVIYTAGVCFDLAGGGVRSGIGVAWGNSDDAGGDTCTRPMEPIVDANREPITSLSKRHPNRFSIRVTEIVDTNPNRTSERAELLAAIWALRLFATNAHDHGRYPVNHQITNVYLAWIIATNSYDVVNGITKKLPQWLLIRRLNLQVLGITEPDNLDLLIALDAEIRKHESEGIQIGFWVIPKDDNQTTERLALEASFWGMTKAVGMCGPFSRPQLGSAPSAVPPEVGKRA